VNRVLDGLKTSPEWRDAAPTACILPIGSFEQHSGHLPLLCDTIVADYFARFLAEELNAALLPPLAYGTSLEQTGFAGTVTLRPETLMQIVRDIADAVQEQGFRTLIVVNGHGGNFALAPVIRDINRADRPLRILLVHVWDHPDPDILETHDRPGLDVHAGEGETSLLMALRPDLVGSDVQDMVPDKPGWRQSDLNTFGMGWAVPRGVYGRPSAASREKGERILDSIKANLRAHVTERLEWLAENRPYGAHETPER